MKCLMFQKINDDLRESLRSGDAFRVGVLRLLISALHNREIEKRGKGMDTELKEEEILEVLNREAKKRRESAQIFESNNRIDLAEKEKKELEILSVYLPQMMSVEEVEKSVEEILKKIDLGTEKNFGKIMGEVMKELKGKADASLVSETLKKEWRVINDYTNSN
ncbi:GatB/YqeY domain-containing protein [Candidatus Wolfebacteria bacterium]|nr:GatB/YqeY domain-containing protein [Candidatus Wolfebacteria bacterium]